MTRKPPLVTEIPPDEIPDIRREIYKKQYHQPAVKSVKQRKREAELLKQLYGKDEME